MYFLHKHCMISLICVSKKNCKLMEIDIQMVVLMAGRWGNEDLLVKRYKVPVKR